MATNCNPHQHYSAEFQHLYHGLSLFLYKTFVIFGKDNQTCIHNLLPHLQDPTSYTGRIINHTDMHTDNLNRAQYNFTAVNMCNNANCTNKCYTIYIHSVQAKVNYSWNLFALHSTTIMHHPYNIQNEVLVWYSAWQKPKHAPCQDACSVLTVHVSTKYFYYRK
jgi:hypothetical protein